MSRCDTLATIQRDESEEDAPYGDDGAISGLTANVAGTLLVGQSHFGVDLREYKHAARASVFERNLPTRLRFELVSTTKVALSCASVYWIYREADPLAEPVAL